MSALPKPSIYVQPAVPRRRRKTRLSRSSNRPLEQPENVTIKTTPSSYTSQFPDVKRLPVKLRVLLLLQKSSFGLAFGLIATSVAVYVSTVRIPEMWSKQYRDLETLQRQERQLVAINESLKHELAQQAQQEENNLELITSDNTIFIPPAPVHLQSEQANLTQQQVSAQNIPMGY